MVIKMGLGDLFKPKYKHSDWKIRLEAVKKIDNQKILLDIAKNDPESEVRKEAINKIEIQNIDDDSVLVDIAKNDSNGFVRRRAVEKIADESVLVDIAKNDSDEFVRRNAVEKIADESVLVDIAKNESDSYVYNKAIEKISDESVLVDIAKNASEDGARRAACSEYKNKYIDKIVNQSPHFYNADLKSFEKRNTLSPSIYNLNNYQVLMCKNYGSAFANWDDIYCTNSYLVHSSIKSRPVIDSEHSSVLFISEDFSDSNNIKKRKYEYTSKQTSVKEVQDPATDYWMDKITTSSKFSKLKAIVIIGITNKITDLSEMFYGCKAETISFSNCDFSNVKNTKDIFYGCGNLKTIHADEKSILSLISFVPESKKYIDNLPKFSESELLDMVHDDSESLRRIAIQNIDDDSVLLDIAKNDPNEDVRTEAFKKIKDENISSSLAPEIVNYYCENCFTDILKSDYCPHCGSTNIRRK